MNMRIKTNILLLLVAAIAASCGSKKTTENVEGATPVGPAFCADSAYRFCKEQCDFGPRTMNSKAHDLCEAWIESNFKRMGMMVTKQKFTVNGYDGTPLRSTNIIASHRPELTTRVMICAHWDSRPWADNDPDSANWRKPVLAANDGASGVAVMLELARLLKGGTTLNVGVDFICFDAEDWGTPQWYDGEDSSDTWALGAQYWSRHLHKPNYEARYGILLDMVGGQGAVFHQEGQSLQMARAIVDKVWNAAAAIGYASSFPTSMGGYITDDHIPVNQYAHIPCIDIIPYYADCEASSFGPTWHTVFDDMQHIDKNTLLAVGQTLVQVIFSEK